MQSRFRVKGILLAALLALAASVGAVSPASAGPAPGAKPKGFRLFASASGSFKINRVYCGLLSAGKICVDSTNTGTNEGGFWPKGSADSYIFNSGAQIAGIIGPDGGPWAGDTTGALFFDATGFYPQGKTLEPIYNYLDPTDVGNWPEEACVPNGDASADVFDPLLQTDPSNNTPVAGQPSTGDITCRKSASEGDIWWLSTDADPTLNSGRAHPLGVVVETRLLGWNAPTDNKDILYAIFTVYNISSTTASDYSNVRPKIRNVLLQAANDFHTKEAAAGVNLPAGGYTMTNLYPAMGADADVGNFIVNYTSVNLPFALGYAWDAEFGQPAGYTFDPAIFTPPFFAGVGFAGIKYLKSPSGPGAIQLFSTTINNGSPIAGAFSDAANTTQLWRYLSGNVSQAAGDGICNTGNSAVTHICYIDNTAPYDIRLFESSTGLTLGPGQEATFVVAYIFAPPVKTGGCSGNCAVKPGNPLKLTSVDSLAIGANLIDSMTGYLGFHDQNGNGIPEQAEFKVVPGSLLGKSLVAQQVFDTKFLRPFAPSAPDFFLIPGDNQVTVLWKPSASEQGGDPYWNIANQPTVIVNGNPQNNGLYDPNYRQFDVEGYRIYRGRVDSPNELQLVAQFDYSGTTFTDFTGQVNPVSTCAPDLGVRAATGCPFDSLVTGNAPNPADKVDYPLVGEVTQVFLGPASLLGNRVLLADGTVNYLHVDTAVVGGEQLIRGSTSVTGSCSPSPCPPLQDTGVPFTYVDKTAVNHFRYYYSVATFDINSLQSGPSSLESARLTKSVTPGPSGPNQFNAGTLSTGIYGRGKHVDSLISAVPTLDPVKGTFSGPFPPPNGAQVGFTGEFVSAVIATPGALKVTLDSLTLGQGWPCPASTPVIYYWTATAGTNTVQLVAPIPQDCFNGTNSSVSLFNAVKIDNTLAKNYGADSTFALKGQFSQDLVGNYYTNAWGRGCINSNPGFTAGACSYNGTRWFDGPSPAQNEVTADPNFGNGANGAAASVNTALANNAGWNNAGHLTGVDVAYQPLAYETTANVWRIVHAMLGGAKRAADYNVYWNATTAGLIDSVIDVTDNVPVQFDSLRMQASYGLLTQANASAPGSFDGRAELSVSDFGCVQPFKSDAQIQSLIPCTAATPYFFTHQASLGPVVFSTASVGADQTSTHTGTGFGMYLAGNLYLFQLTALPRGTVWSMRDYVGAISGGNGFAGNQGPYAFYPVERPFSAVGASVVVNYNVVHNLLPVTGADLSKVHTVPDPYYVTDAYEQSTDAKIIKFVNLPTRAIIRIYSTSGILVNLIEHNSTVSSEETWNVRNRNNQVVASGVYFYHIESNVGSGTARRVGRMTIINFTE